ncbi:hypothetical protein ACJRO7_006999, partial [Eucalyptus globulus]
KRIARKYHSWMMFHPLRLLLCRQLLLNCTVLIRGTGKGRKSFEAWMMTMQLYQEAMTHPRMPWIH